MPFVAATPIVPADADDEAPLTAADPVETDPEEERLVLVRPTCVLPAAVPPSPEAPEATVPTPFPTWLDIVGLSHELMSFLEL